MHQYVLIGHSAGACLAFQVYDAVEGCIAIAGVEGLYDLENLVTEYPDYGGFVQDAFGSDRSVWKEASPDHIVQQRTLPTNLTVLLIQSRDDELLSPRQTEIMFKSVQKAKAILKEIAWITGSHDESITTPTFHDLIYNFIITLKTA
jgi:kynurenine formamidase